MRKGDQLVFLKNLIIEEVDKHGYSCTATFSSEVKQSVLFLSCSKILRYFSIHSSVYYQSLYIPTTGANSELVEVYYKTSGRFCDVNQHQLVK